jgi:isoquinoline 1-oxidoreductase beta subunit
MAASKLAPSGTPALKDPSKFTLIGAERLPRKDSHDKTNGTATFAMDVKVPNMLYVTLLRSLRFGGKLTSFDAAAASGAQGFVAAKALPNMAGVAVYGKSTWAAIKARRAITAQWDDSAADMRGSPEAILDHQAFPDAGPAYDATHKGNFDNVKALADSATRTVEAEFLFPLLAHAPMEPLNRVIEPTKDGVRIHDGSQFRTITQAVVASVLQISPEKVQIFTCYAGGSFGRRATAAYDYQAQAAMAFTLMGGKQEIKLVWTREDDLAGGYHRPDGGAPRENRDRQGWEDRRLGAPHGRPVHRQGHAVRIDAGGGRRRPLLGGRHCRCAVFDPQQGRWAHRLCFPHAHSLVALRRTFSLRIPDGSVDGHGRRGRRCGPGSVPARAPR